MSDIVNVSRRNDTPPKRRVEIVVPLLFLAIPVAVFGSVWGEDINHVWYSLGAGSSQAGMFPLAANNFGKVLILGNPVYDFGIAAGVRLPLQTGAGASVMVLLRHVAAAEVIALVGVVLLAGVALVVLQRALDVLGAEGSLLRLGLLMANLFIPAYYITQFDWYSLSIGYIAMLTLVATAVVLLGAQNSGSWHPRDGHVVILGISIVLFALPSSYISYFHVSALAVITALAVGNKRLWSGVKALGSRMLSVFPLVIVSTLTIALTAWDLYVTGEEQSGLSRQTKPTTLFSPLESFDAAKHFLKQVLTSDWRGVVGAIDAGTVQSFAAATTPVALFLTVSIGCILVFGILRFRSMLVGSFGAAERFLVVGIGVGVIALWWVPIPGDLGVSDQNLYGHLVTVCSLLFTGHLSGRISRTLRIGHRDRPALRGMYSGLIGLFVANCFLLAPTALRDTIDDRRVTIAPNSTGIMLARSVSSTNITTAITRITTNQRLMSFTEAFDSQKYFQSTYPGYVSYNDLTARGVPTINAYPKVRDATNITPGIRYSSSLAPSSLRIETSTFCPVAPIRFLAVTTLVLSAQQKRDCRSQIDESSPMRNRYLGVRDGVVLSAVEYADHPSYWASQFGISSNKCAVIERSCWDDLQWNADESSRIRLFVNDGSSAAPPVKVVLSKAPGGDNWLILPLSFDDRLKVTITGSDQQLRVESVNGFAAVQPPESTSSVELGVTISPDVRMYAYGLMPYAWVGASLWSWFLWRRKRG